MIGPVEYLPDASVDAEQDLQIRALLSICFAGPGDVDFMERRYFREPCSQRWVIHHEGNTIAHTGIHEKSVIHDSRTYAIGGICEVCVHPDFRRQGAVAPMLREAHDWLAQHDFDFAVLFGRAEIYTSSGYFQVENLFCDPEEAQGGNQRTQINAMVKEVAKVSWPDGEVYLPGLTF